MPPKSKIACAFCSKSLVNYVSCDTCKKYYHTGCFCKIKAAYIDMNGLVICCNSGVVSDYEAREQEILRSRVHISNENGTTCDCEAKEKEIKTLRERIRTLNELNLEMSLENATQMSRVESDFDVKCLNGEGNAQKLDKILENVNDLHLSLCDQMSGVKSLLVSDPSRVDMGRKEDLSVMISEQVSNMRNLGDGSLAGTCSQEHLNSVATEEAGAQALVRSGVAGGCGGTSGCDSLQVGAKRPNILIIGDSHARGGTQYLQRFFKETYSVMTVVKPNASLLNVVGDIQSWTKDFDKSDFVLIMGGTNDILNNRVFPKRKLNDIVNGIVHTNVMFLSVPYLRDKYELDDFVYNFNTDLYDFCCVYNSHGIVFLDVNSILDRSDKLSRGVHLARWGKLKLFEWVARSVSYHNSCNKLVNCGNRFDFDFVYTEQFAGGVYCLERKVTNSSLNNRSGNLIEVDTASNAFL